LGQSKKQKKHIFDSLPRGKKLRRIKWTTKATSQQIFRTFFYPLKCQRVWRLTEGGDGGVVPRFLGVSFRFGRATKWKSEKLRVLCVLRLTGIFRGIFFSGLNWVGIKVKK